MTKKTELKVVKDEPELKLHYSDSEDISPREVKEPTKAEIKKAEREEKERIKKQAEFQAKQMDQQIVVMGEAVKASICNKCIHCGNPNKDFDRFKVKSSLGDELMTPMNFCKLVGLSLVDVEECEKFKKV